MILVTYNVHSWVGMDGRRDPERIASVLEELEADVVTLQEVWTRTGFRHDPLSRVARRLGMHEAFAATRRHRGRWFGNAVLSKWSMSAPQSIDLTFEARESRGAVLCEIVHRDVTFTVASTHLGLLRRERWDQVGRLCEVLDAHTEGPRVAAGDFNCWIPYRDADRALTAHFGPIQALRTYPAARPVFRLDRIFATGGLEPARCWVPRHELARVASDHLPVAAHLVLRPGSP